MFKRIITVAVLGVAALVWAPRNADAQVYIGRFAPVRRVAARAVLPPYPVARTVLPPYPVARAVISAPVYSPWIGYSSYTPYYAGYNGYGYGYDYGYSAPLVYGSGVGVAVY